MAVTIYVGPQSGDLDGPQNIHLTVFRGSARSQIELEGVTARSLEETGDEAILRALEQFAEEILEAAKSRRPLFWRPPAPQN